MPQAPRGGLIERQAHYEGAVRQYLRALSPRAEFSIVIAGAFGLFIFHSFREVFHPAPPGRISEAHLQFLLLYEPLTLAALLTFLAVRGWTLSDIGLRPSAKGTLLDTLIGLGLALAAYLAYAAAWTAAMTLFPVQLTQAAIAHRSLVAPGIHLTTAVAVSLVNPIFEEIFVCGYVVSALKRARSPMWTAINVSVAIRLLYHLYQGAVGVIGMIPGGLVFAYWYARSDRLWPVIVAHAVADILALLPYSAA